jgi:hypothetical protein
MKIEQRKWTTDQQWELLRDDTLSDDPQLVLAFGERDIVKNVDRYNEVKAFYPKAAIIFCSTAGEIYDDEVNDSSISLVALHFEKTRLSFVEMDVESIADSYSLGAKLAQQMSKEDLAHVMVFSDGLNINGTNLTKGLSQGLDHKIAITGGLVGDGPNFIETAVGLNGPAQKNKIVVVGFHGHDLEIGYGSFGGWDTFGGERLITKSEGSTLYEIDGQPALELYKQYLGSQSADLPISGLLFPIGLHLQNHKGEDITVVRTLLAVNEADQSMTFAGDMPEGTKARLMKANFERVIGAAASAATMSLEGLAGSKPDLAILISCVGRKLVLKDRSVEEVDAVRNILGQGVVTTGFYSYGEICPTNATEKECKLHNQTMTITTFKEN